MAKEQKFTKQDKAEKNKIKEVKVEETQDQKKCFATEQKQR